MINRVTPAFIGEFGMMLRNVDTVLSEVFVFKLFRAETATGTVTSPAIVIGGVLSQNERDMFSLLTIIRL